MADDREANASAYPSGSDGTEMLETRAKVAPKPHRSTGNTSHSDVSVEPKRQLKRAKEPNRAKVNPCQAKTMFQ